jgi:hypothetical protein
VLVFVNLNIGGSPAPWLAFFPPLLFYLAKPPANCVEFVNSKLAFSYTGRSKNNGPYPAQRQTATSFNVIHAAIVNILAMLASSDHQYSRIHATGTIIANISILS